MTGGVADSGVSSVSRTERVPRRWPRPGASTTPASDRAVPGPRSRLGTAADLAEPCLVDVLRQLAAMGGAARWSDLVGGWSDRRQLERLVAAGEVIDHLGGCYALPSAPDWILRARQFRGLVTCVSWAQVRGLAVLEPSHRVHLAVPASRGGKSSPVRPTRAVVLHRSAAVTVRDCERPLARAEVALAHILRCLEPRSAIVTVDSALHARLSTSEEIRAELTNRASVAARLTLDRCDPRSESLLESLARLELRAAGLRVEVAVPIEGVGWVDLLVERRLVIELDGFEFHSSRQAFGNDRRRDRALAALGLTVLRFTYDEVVHCPGLVRAAALAALAASSR